MKHMNVVCVMVFCFLLVFSCDDNSVPGHAGIVQDALQEMEKDFEFGGVIAGLRTKNGDIDYGLFGLSQPDILLSPMMSMGFGSNTKTFTAVLIFKLIEEGKISVHDNLINLLPERVNERINGAITIEQLLNHSSGIFDPLNHSDKLLRIVMAEPDRAISIDEYFEHIEAPLFAPGDQYFYSNANYMLLGLIIEKITGQAYHQYLRAHILEPLQMTSTFLSGKEQINIEIGNSWDSMGKSLLDYPRNAIESVSWSAGSIFSTVGDMMHWYSALFAGKIINRTSLDKMMTTHPSISNLNYGSGIFCAVTEGRSFCFHSGQTIAYNSFMLYNENTGDVIAVVVNQIEIDPEDIAYRIMDRISE